MTEPVYNTRSFFSDGPGSGGGEFSKRFASQKHPRWLNKSLPTHKAAPREPGVAINWSNAIEALLAFSLYSFAPFFPPPAVTFFMGGDALFGMFPLTGIYFRCELDSRNTSCEALDSSRHWSLSLCSRMSHIDNTNNALFTRCGLQDPLIRYVSHHLEQAETSYRATRLGLCLNVP